MIRVCARPVHEAHATWTSHPQSNVTVYDTHSHHTGHVCQPRVLNVNLLAPQIPAPLTYKRSRSPWSGLGGNTRVTDVTTLRIVRCNGVTGSI